MRICNDTTKSGTDFKSGNLYILKKSTNKYIYLYTNYKRMVHVQNGVEVSALTPHEWEDVTDQYCLVKETK